MIKTLTYIRDKTLLRNPYFQLIKHVFHIYGKIV